MDNIKIICVIPKSKTYCKYIINDGEIHSKKYNDLKNFLVSLVPSLSYQIAEKIQSFSYFILLIDEKEIIDLRVNPQDKIEDIKNTFKNFNIDKAYRYIQANKKSKPIDKIKRSNDIIQKISNIGR